MRGLHNHGPCLQARRESSKHLASESIAVGSLTLPRLADLHRDVCEGNHNRPWPLNLQVVVIAFVMISNVHRAAANERVDIGVSRVNLARTDERVTVPGLAVAPSRVSTTFSVSVSGREGVLSLNTMREFGVNAVRGPLGWRQT